MIDPRDERWLRKVLEDCFEYKPDEIDNKKDLLGFKILIEEFVKNIEKKVGKAHRLWKSRPCSKELEERLHSIEKSLLYLKRFCRPR